MWPAYFTMLAGQRFNRFNLTLGLGYDYPNPVFDCYLHFAYPFLVKVPGYDVRAAPLPDGERDLNLEMLRYISDEAAARGLDFQLGLWTHGYQPPKGSHPNYTIEGLTPADPRLLLPRRLACRAQGLPQYQWRHHSRTRGKRHSRNRVSTSGKPC